MIPHTSTRTSVLRGSTGKNNSCKQPLFVKKNIKRLLLERTVQLTILYYKIATQPMDQSRISQDKIMFPIHFMQGPHVGRIYS